MRAGDFSNAALVLFGHGTTLDTESGVALVQHAAELRRRCMFGEVKAAFWKQEPKLADVVEQTKHPRVFLVPFFFSEGFFSEQTIPAALGFETREGRVLKRALERGGQSWFYCRPVGTHPMMTKVILASVRRVLSRFPFPNPPELSKTSLVIAGHGTAQHKGSGEAVRRHAEAIRGLGIFDGVYPAFLEEDPRIGSCYQLARTRHIVVVPFFGGDGPHVLQDIPVQLGQAAEVVRRRLEERTTAWPNPTEKHGKLVWLAPSVGLDPAMAEVILQSVAEIEGAAVAETQR